MTHTLRTRSVLALSVAAALTLTACTGGHHRSATGSSTAPSSIASSPSKPGVGTVPIVNPAAPQPKPPSPNPGAGQTGTRDQVPWKQLGPGWRLVQPTGAVLEPTLYLYDAAGERYLISSTLPHDYRLVGWSADGSTAALEALGAWSGVQLLDVRQNILGARIAHADFVTFTRPQGQALLVSVKYGNQLNVQRFGRDGRHQLSYGDHVLGQDFAAGQGAIYLADGSAFLTHTGGKAALISNGDRLLQTYAIPTGYRTCRPVKLWTPGTFLEACISKDDLRTGLFAQAIASSSRRTVAADATHDYFQAWLLSNGDALVWADLGHCVSDPYLIEHPNGSMVRLRVPAGLQPYAGIVNVAGEVATFGLVPGSACPVANTEQQTDYNILTGATRVLPLIGPATFIDLGAS